MSQLSKSIKTSLRLTRALHGVGGFAPPRGSHTWGKVFSSTILQCILIAFDDNYLWAKGPSAPSHSENHVLHSMHSIKYST